MQRLNKASPLHRAIDLRLSKSQPYVILHPLTLPYNTVPASLAYCKTEPLKLRRNNFQKTLFEHIYIPQSCRHCLLPPVCDVSISVSDIAAFCIVPKSQRQKQNGTVRLLTTLYRTSSNYCMMFLIRVGYFMPILCRSCINIPMHLYTYLLY